MRRREFIRLLGGAMAWPVAAHAQLPEQRKRRIGVLQFLAEKDTESTTRHKAFGAVTAFAGSANGGVIVTSGGTGFNRELIVALAARHRLPAVYPFRYF